MNFLREEGKLKRCSFLILDCSFTGIEVLCTPCSLIANVGSKQRNKQTLKQLSAVMGIRDQNHLTEFAEVSFEVPSRNGPWVSYSHFLPSIVSVCFQTIFFSHPSSAAFKKNINCFTFFLCPCVCAINIWFQILLLHLIAGWPWASCWISLRFNLFILKMGIITVLTLELCSKD